MCGIAVAIDWDGAEAAVAQLIGGILHRGDVTDPLVSPRPRTAFATRRLRIVDAEHNRQPAISWDGRTLVSFNGEIYNFRALRAELEAAGATFRTDGDTEVLAAALSMWGGRALQRLSGMYAFVALDLKTGEFLAARDPLGIKPLYLVRGAEGWLFCSEITPLLGASETGEVLLLPPGHFLTRDKLGRFSTLLDEPKPPGPDTRDLDRLLQAAVESHLPPDLPFATFFSGGIDSTLMAHYARRLRPEAPGYFLGDATAPDYPFAAEYAERAGLDLRMVPLDTSQATLAAELEDLVASVEGFEPEVVRDAYCNALLSRAVHRDGYRVVLAGEGADELFAGYRPLEVGFAHDEAIGRDIRQQTLEQMGRTNLQRLDRSAMRYSVEARVPFLDPAVVAAALGYSGAELVVGAGAAAVGKQPLRALYDLHAQALPRSIARRQKIGLHLGSGADASADRSPWRELAEQRIGERAFADGRRRLADYGIQTKEELMMFEALERRLDVARVPHLRHRNALAVPDAVVEACRPT